MSPNCRCRTRVLWITLQLLVFAYPGPRAAMAIARYTPYVSEFEYASRFHPSKNPDCPTSGWADNSGSNLGSRRYRRSPEEGAPVGQEPSIEVRAILVRCPKTTEETDDIMINRNIYNITAGRSQDILDFHGFDRDEPAHHSEVRDCRRKIIITMKFNNIGRTKTREEFVVIDHVLDPVTMHKARLLNPFVVKVRQEPVLQLYGLKFQGVVNAEAREEVINKKLSNYTGCDDVSDNPTCGQMLFEGKPIPYSQGFCCSCDPELNVQRQTSIINESVASSFPSFFSKGREKSIRPYKSPRSVGGNLRDNFFDLDSENTENLESPKNEESRRDDTRRSSYQSLVNSSNAKYGREMKPKEDKNSTIDGSYDDERYLINLKKIEKENRGQPKWNRFPDDGDDKNTIAPYIAHIPPKYSRRRSNSSGSINRVREMSSIVGQKSSENDRKNGNAISQLRSYGKETFPNPQPMPNRYPSSYQNLRSLNLAAELTKLEEDYKNIRLSSIMRAEERNNEAKAKLQIDTSIENNTERKPNNDHAKNFVAFGDKTMTKNYGRESTLSIDIKFAVKPKEKAIIRLPISVLKSTSTYSRKLLPTTTSSFPETGKGKSKGFSNVSRVDFHAREFTTSTSKKFESDVADLLANAVMSENDENFSFNAQTSNDGHAILEDTYNATSYENSTTESRYPFVVTEENLHNADNHENSFDNPSNEVESPSDSTSSFSSGNISADDAILLSGSLKNQLVNWFSHDERNNFELESSRKKLNEYSEEDGEVRHGGEVGDPKNVRTTGDNLSKGDIRYESRTTTTVRNRRPVELYLAPEQGYDPILNKEDKEITEETRQRNEKALHKDYLDYSIPEEMNFVSSKKSWNRNALRSHRSVDEDESLFVKNNDRQRNIDQQIENEFEEISDALRDAADGSKVLREKPKSEATFEGDNSVVRKFAMMFDKIPKPTRDNRLAIHGPTAVEEDREIHTEILKHTEAFVEPVSQIMLTTEHQIIVDRFKISNDLQKIPIDHEKSLQEPRLHDSVAKIVRSKLRDRKHESSATALPKSTTVTVKNEPITEQITGIFQTTDQRVIIDRLKFVNNFKEIADEQPLRSEVSNNPNFPEVSSTIRDVDREKDYKSAKSDKVAAINRGSSFRSALSPVLMIANLKKELRKEAEHYSSISTVPSAARRSNFEEFRKHAEAVDAVREVNTVLTPAEKVEDLITDEETLPPDEETKYTTDSMSKTAYFRTSSIESSTINESIFPELAIQSFDAKFTNNNRAVPHRRAKKILILLEDSSSSSTARPVRWENKKHYKKRLHRRRDRRNNRHKKRSIKKRRNIVDVVPVVSIVKGRSENEDDEHPWYDTSTESKATYTKDRRNGFTTNPASSITLADISLQNRKKRFDIETPSDSKDIPENDQRATEFSNESMRTSMARQFHLSITRIPESDYRASVAGLRIEEIPKKNKEQSVSMINSEDAKILTINGPEKLGEVDEMPIFRDTKNLNTERRVIGEIISETSERSKRNLNNLFAEKSLNSEPSDHAERRLKDGGRGNKRNYPVVSYESEAMPQIFYDYENSEASSDVDKGNDKSNRILDSFISDDLPLVNREKYHRDASNSDNFRVKSSLAVPMNSNGRLIVKRRYSTSRNDRLDDRSDEEIVPKNADLFRKDFSTESSASLGAKGRSRGNCTVNQFSIEPSNGWKEKMELLKLKKHADVLKEYLNWRQDVASPESQGIPGYTTRISLTNARDEQTSDFFTTNNFRASDETTTARSTVSKYSTITEEFTNTDEQSTDTSNPAITTDEHSFTNVTTNTDSFETPVILRATNPSGNCSTDALATTIKVQTFTNCLDNKTEENDDDEGSTGRILPPCGHQDELLTTCRREQESVTLSPVSPHTSSNVSRDHGKHLSDVDEDLIIISVMEKNRLKNKNRFGATKHVEDSSKVHRIHNNVVFPPVSRHHRHRHKSRNNKIPVVRKPDNIRYNRRTGRQLMSFGDLDESNSDEETYENSDENHEVNLSNDEDIFNGEEVDSEIWNQKWNRMIDKIIHENSTDSLKSTNSSRLLMKKTPGDERSAMQQLRFNNADKYIRQIAKNIVHNTNIHETKHKGKFVDKVEARRHKGSSRRHRSARRREFLRRKLQSHPIERRKVVRDSASGEDFGNYEDKRSALRVLSKTDDLYDGKRDLSSQRLYPEPRNVESNAGTSKEVSEEDKGRDFAISLSGKIHVEGGTNGQPMSISFDTSPEIQNSNETTNTNSTGTTKFDNVTKSDDESAPSTNFLSSLFNIASVPKDLSHHSSEENKNVNANSSIRQSVRDINEDGLRSSRENHRSKYRKLSRKHSKNRKSRAADEENFQRFDKYRHDRSYDLEDSQYLENIDEESESDDYPESPINEYYSDVGAYDDAPVESAQRRSSNTGNSCPKIDTAPTLADHMPNGPEVRVIKIIPLNAPKSSRMTASQMPKMKDDLPGMTVKPGKIKPVALPWIENDDANPTRDTIDEDNFPKSSDSCLSQSASSDGNSKNADDVNASSIDRKNPVNLKVIGLISMKQPSSSANGKSNLHSESNYEIVPLVHVKIEQQSGNRDVPSQPMEDRCPDIDMTNSSPDSHRDQSPCSQFNNEGYNKQREDNTQRPEVATLNMENDEELREPIDIGRCRGSNRKDTEVLADYSNDDKPYRTLPTEVLSPCAGNQEMTTTSNTKLHRVASFGSNSRKKIRLKNMLAIMEFMKKIKEIMNGEEASELSGGNDKDIVIKLERVVVLPNNGSNGIRKKIEEPEETTDRVVMIGEGVRHKPSMNGVNFENKLRPSNDEGSNGTNDSPNSGNNFNEEDLGNKSMKTNEKGAEKNRDKSFLFSGENDELRGVNHSGANDTYPGNDSVDEHPKDGDSSTDLHNHKIQLIERLKNTQNFVDTNNNEDNLLAEASGENVSNPYANSSDFDSSGKVDLQNSERKIHHRFRNSQSPEANELFQDDVNDVSTNERRAEDNDFSTIPKTKRHQSLIRQMRYDSRNERDAKRQMYRRKSLPTSREISRLPNGKFERYAAAKGIPKEKRTRKKKKKKRRRKKKRKKKKKKGKSHREAAVKAKAWWPFGRQLMSVSEERGVILDSNFDRNKVEPVETKRYGNRRVSMPFDARRRRRVHRAKYPHERNKKKRRKHKKRKKKKKTKKTRGKDKKKSGFRSKRQIKPGGTQFRGGQDCLDRRHPSDVNPAKYLESAHCLRFSDLWYSVYELESPIMEHTVYLQLFEKHSLADGTTHWDDLTQGTMVRMGTFTRHQRDSKPTIAFTYSGAKIESQKRALNLDPANQRLLVPSPVAIKKSSHRHDAKSGLGEYLVVQSSAISKDGNDCDKAGVGFAAFAKQEDRCGRAKGSCLKNQPLAYWRHDTEARESGRPGCYFLSNFATVPTNPIKYNVSGSGSREYLSLEYHSAHVSAIDIEVRTDYNAIIRVGSSGRVTEVYVDSTASEHTVVTVVISNMGLASSPYQPRITDCPAGLPVSWSKAKGIMQVVPPQHDQRVTLDLYGQLLINGFHCSVEVVNHRGELVAMRRIRVQKMDRCFCVWHCLCACIGSVSGMGCQPMSPEHYHAAGFQGPVPVVTTETSILMNAVKDVLMLSALLVLLLLFLGILKWFVGMFAPAVGRWGLDSLLDGSRIEKYLEPELKCRCVVTDDNGALVHPDTGQRTVRICSRKLEFILNLIFFLTYPIAMCCSYFRKSLNESRQRNCCPDESKMCLINEKESCPKMICVNTYGDSRNTKLEAEDTRYVMNELKKSQESLGNPKRTKKNDSHANREDNKVSKKSLRKNKSVSDVRARRFVDDLLKRRMVFRNLTVPIGGLSLPAGIAYSLRGYFLNAEDGGYRFITPCPFKQHWLIVNNEKKASKPPEIYPSNHFMRSYGTARDVYESNELSLTPRGVCVNVQYLEDG